MLSWAWVGLGASEGVGLCGSRVRLGVGPLFLFGPPVGSDQGELPIRPVSLQGNLSLQGQQSCSEALLPLRPAKLSLTGSQSYLTLRLAVQSQARGPVTGLWSKPWTALLAWEWDSLGQQSLPETA